MRMTLPELVTGIRQVRAVPLRDLLFVRSWCSTIMCHLCDETAETPIFLSSQNKSEISSLSYTTVARLPRTEAAVDLPM